MMRNGLNDEIPIFLIRSHEKIMRIYVELCFNTMVSFSYHLAMRNMMRMPITGSVDYSIGTYVIGFLVIFA